MTDAKRILPLTCDQHARLGLRLQGSSGPAQPSSRYVEGKADGATQAELDQLMNSLESCEKR